MATDPAVRIAALREVPLFRGLRKKTLLELDLRAEEAHFPAGVTLITEGEHGDSLYVLLSGRVAVYRGGALMGELTACDYFGEMSLIDGDPRSATIVALDATSVLMIQAGDFDALLRLPEVAREILRGLTALIRNPQTKLPGEDEPNS